MKAHVNLMAPDLLQGENFRVQGLAFPVGFLLFFLGILAATWIEVLKIQSMEDRIAEMGERKAQIILSLAGLRSETKSLSERANRSASSEKERARRLKDLEAQRILWSALLQEISVMVPEGIWLTKMESLGSSGGASNIDETAEKLKFVGFGMAYSDVTQFMAALARSENFGKVSLLQAQKSKDDISPRIFFEVTANIRRS